MKTRLKLTLNVYYDADSENYGTNDLEIMARIDEENFIQSPYEIAGFFNEDDCDYDIKVAPLNKEKKIVK